MSSNSTGRWLRLETAWSSSGWVADLEPAGRLAWVELLCYVKAHGFDGRCRALPVNVAVRQWGIERSSIESMLEAAQGGPDPALRSEDGSWIICKWSVYQRDPTGAERARRYRESRASRVTPVTERDVTATSTSTSTNTREEDPPPTPPRGEAARRPEPEREAARKPKPPDPPEPPGFREIWEAYPRRSGSQPRRPAQAAYQARVREGKITPEDALEAVQRYRAWCEATGKVGTETVMQASSFFGPQKEGYLQDWSLPSGPAGGGPRTFGQMKRENTKSATALVLRRLGECPENSESSLSPSKRVPYTEE